MLRNSILHVNVLLQTLLHHPPISGPLSVEPLRMRHRAIVSPFLAVRANRVKMGASTQQHCIRASGYCREYQ